MVTRFADAAQVMQHALDLAARGRSSVEPNPLVGAVVVDDQLTLLGAGYHERYGGPHAEVHALRQAGQNASGKHLFVTLEPCNHTGKTPPCTAAVISAGIRRVTIGCVDPAAHTQGRGIARLREAGIEVEVGLLQHQAERLIRPFTKLMLTGMPYVHAKWAMTLDGKIATRTGSSQWISNETSRGVAHQIRGQMDAILAGRRTVAADDPLLTARPPGPRTPARIVMDSHATLPFTSRLVETIDQAPVLLACLPDAPAEKTRQLRKAGVELLVCPPDASGRPDLTHLLKQLGARKMTNLLVEGGGELLGAMLTSNLIDEVHAFIAAKLVGGNQAATPIGGTGVELMSQALQLTDTTVRMLDSDIYLRGELPLTPQLSTQNSPSDRANTTESASPHPSTSSSESSA